MKWFSSRCGQHAPKSLVSPRAGPENKREEFTARHRRANVIVYRPQNLVTQIMETAFEDQALNLGKQNSEKGSLSSNDGSVSKPAADSMGTTGLRQLDRCPADFGDTSSDDVLPIRDHEMLWKILSARPGWERKVQKGTRGITKGFVQYHSGALKTKKRQPFHSACPPACRLPWPDLYEASTSMLSSSVEMVNMCAGSEIFELRIAKDRQPGFTNNLVEYPRIIAKTDRPPSRNWYQRIWITRRLLKNDNGRRSLNYNCNVYVPPFTQSVEDVDLNSLERT